MTTYTLYHGTLYYKKILTEGFSLSTDEINAYPGVSFAFHKEYAKDYATEKGKVIKVKVLIKNPIAFGSEKVTKYMPVGWHDVTDFYITAHELGYDAVFGKGEVRIFDTKHITIIGIED